MLDDARDVVVEELRGLLAQRDGQMTALTAAVAELTATNAELVARVARLEHLLSRNSGNSSMPPSRDDDPGRTPPTAKPKPAAGKRKKGKQPGAAGGESGVAGESFLGRTVVPAGAV